MDSRILPDQFCDAYEALWTKAFTEGGVDGGGPEGRGNHPLNGNTAALGRADGKPVGQWRVSSGETTTIDKTGGPGRKQVGKTSRFLKDEAAFRMKTRVDKRLRAISREISAFLDGRKLKVVAFRICTGRCRKFGDAEWNFCANCGGPMREVEEND